MSDILKQTESTLLDAASLEPKDLQAILDSTQIKSVDAADIYCQLMQHESWGMEDSIVKQGSFGIDRGFGLRVMAGEKTGFAYADDISLNALEDAAKSARSIIHQGEHQAMSKVQIQKGHDLYLPDNPLQSISDEKKIKLLHELDKLARDSDPRVKQVMIRLSASFSHVLVMNQEGRLAADIRPLVSLMISVVMEENGRHEQGSGGGGGRFGLDYFLENNKAHEYVKKAVRQAALNLTAKPVPAGAMAVVLGPGWPGVLLHEAVGHGLEGDFNRKGSSMYAGRIGEKVASELCTVIDDGTIANRRGSLNIDDEGNPTQRNVLIENGILKQYMQDDLNARLMGVAPTGNGRRESYSELPMPRMTNTFMLAGESDPEEIIKSLDKGLYAVDFAGGQVDITSGKFVFSMSEAYWVEDGKIQYPVKGATLIGDGPDVLQKISMVGNDLEFDSGIGTCGKQGQSVPVGVGQPTLKISEVTVGGAG